MLSHNRLGQAMFAAFIAAESNAVKLKGFNLGGLGGGLSSLSGGVTGAVTGGDFGGLLQSGLSAAGNVTDG